jgi:hypothetical protein
MSAGMFKVDYLKTGKPASGNALINSKSGIEFYTNLFPKNNEIFSTLSHTNH